MARLTSMLAAGLAMLAALSVAPPAADAVDDVFLLLDGIPGDVTARDHEGWIRVLAVGSSVAVPSGATRPVFSDLSILKAIDSASPRLLVTVASGKRLPEAVLEFVRPGESAFTYFRIVLEDVEVAGVRASANAVGDSLTEFLTLRYERITWEYTPQGPGGGAGTKITGCWDIARNQQC